MYIYILPGVKIQAKMGVCIKLTVQFGMNENHWLKNKMCVRKACQTCDA